MFELAASELDAWCRSPSAVDDLRQSHPLLIVHDDSAHAIEPRPIRGLVVVAQPTDESPPAWGALADLSYVVGGSARVSEQVNDAVGRSPQAAVALGELLRITELVEPALGLLAESAVYSMLQGGREHLRWLAERRPPEPTADAAPHVVLDRDDGRLIVTLNRPTRHNAFATSLRDHLVESLQLVEADDSITEVVIRGSGPSFCSGGDLDEFGTSPGPATGHRIRVDRSAAAALWRVRDRVTVELHGACIGAGIELAAVASRVRADQSTAISLPEVAMGLVPGSGGTVSICRRIGRQQTLLLALTGERIDAATALDLGLVDEINIIER